MSKRDTGMAKLENALTKASGELAEAVALLRGIEWNGEDDRCPSCASWGPGHASGCKIDVFLKRHP